MTTFFSRELSQALQDAGCVSQSNFYYVTTVGYVECNYLPRLKWPEDFSSKEVQAFHPWDLCGPSEIARENRKIIWPEVDPNCTSGCLAEDHRHELIDLPSHEEQEAYVWATMRKAA